MTPNKSKITKQKPLRFMGKISIKYTLKTTLLPANLEYNFHTYYDDSYILHNFVHNFVDGNYTYPTPSINVERYISKIVCANDKVIVAQNTTNIVTGI